MDWPIRVRVLSPVPRQSNSSRPAFPAFVLAPFRSAKDNAAPRPSDEHYLWPGRRREVEDCLWGPVLARKARLSASRAARGDEPSTSPEQSRGDWTGGAARYSCWLYARPVAAAPKGQGGAGEPSVLGPNLGAVGLRGREAYDRRELDPSEERLAAPPILFLSRRL